MATNYPIDPSKPGLVMCIDPGLRHVGVALFDARGKLLRAGLPRSTVQPPVRGAEAWKAAGLAALGWWNALPAVRHLFEPQLVVVEEQKIDQRTHNPDDVLQCNGAAGALTMLFPLTQVRGVIPEHWKGSIAKADMTERIKQRLVATGEFGVLDPCAPGLVHNVLDACGIGLWLFGRLTAKRIIHRE